MTDSESTPPGIYLVNATGEMAALATEDGSGDTKLLREAVEEHTDLYVVGDVVHLVMSGNTVLTATPSRRLARMDRDKYGGTTVHRPLEVPDSGTFQDKKPTNDN